MRNEKPKQKSVSKSGDHKGVGKIESKIRKNSEDSSPSAEELWKGGREQSEEEDTRQREIKGTKFICSNDDEHTKMYGSNKGKGM